MELQNWYTLGTNRKESGVEHYHLSTEWQNGGRLGFFWDRKFEHLDRPFEVFPGIRVAPGSYQFRQLGADYKTDPSAVLFLSGFVWMGGFYDGTIKTLDFGGGVRRGQNLTWTATYTKNFIRLPAGNFNTDLVNLRFNWSFTPKSYFQTLTQYNSRTNQIGHCAGSARTGERTLRVSVDAALRAGIFKASGSFDPMGWSVGARRSFPRP